MVAAGIILIIQFIKFCFVGVLNTLLTLVAIDIFWDKLHFPYDLANVFGFILGFVNSFIMNKLWTFRSRNKVLRESLLFLAAFALSYGLQFIVLKLAITRIIGVFVVPFPGDLTLTMKYAQIIALIPYTASNFLLNKYISFRNREGSHE